MHNTHTHRHTHTRHNSLSSGVLVTAAFAAALFLSPLVVPCLITFVRTLYALCCFVCEHGCAMYVGCFLTHIFCSQCKRTCCSPLELQQLLTALWLQTSAFALLVALSFLYPLVEWPTLLLLALSLASTFMAVRCLNSPSNTIYRRIFPIVFGGSVALLAGVRLYHEIEVQAARV